MAKFHISGLNPLNPLFSCQKNKKTKRKNRRILSFNHLSKVFVWALWIPRGHGRYGNKVRSGPWWFGRQLFSWRRPNRFGRPDMSPLANPVGSVRKRFDPIPFYLMQCAHAVSRRPGADNDLWKKGILNYLTNTLLYGSVTAVAHHV